MTTRYSNQVTDIHAGDVETILYHTGLRWVSKIKDVKEAFFNLFCFLGVLCLLLFLEIDKFASERKEVPGLHRAVRVVS